MQIGFIGLGKMGGRMAEKLIVEGHDVVVWNRSQEPIDTLRSKISTLDDKAKHLTSVDTIENLVKSLSAPRIVWLMLPAGETTETILTEVKQYVTEHDIVVDGGNSNFKDTDRRYTDFKQKKVKFMGIGVSGGIIAARKGYPLMVGGDHSGYEYITPLLDSLAKEHGGHEYFGEGGAGHFVKMVHNGMEYGIMQSLGEGFGVLQKSPYELDLLKVAELYQKGTLVSGFMLDRVGEVLEQDPQLTGIEGVIDESGEATWTVEQARAEGVEIGIIDASLDFRKRSHVDPKVSSSYAAKMVAALRRAFGGHPVKNKE